MWHLYVFVLRLGFVLFELLLGTGKTLSIICSALQWVVDQKQKKKSETLIKSDNNITNDGQCGLDDEPDWLRNFVANKDCQVQDKKIKKKKSGFGLRTIGERKNQEIPRDRFSHSKEKDECCTKKKYENLQKKNDLPELDDDEFLLEEYESEEEGVIGGGKSKRKAGGGTISSSSYEEDEEDGFDEEEVLKVYFCSRTHSQLSQFIKELRKTVLADEIKVVSLGSRKNFCINEGEDSVIYVISLQYINVLRFSFYLWDFHFRGSETWKLYSH